jgi:tRNA dimethylallyltransferase
MNKKTCIIVSGPTAAGKTAFAIDLALQKNTQIISADSRQCFKELNIGVAKPSPEQLKKVKHYFINSHSINEEVNAKIFEEYALKAVEEIFENNDTAIMVGGTGLYIKAFSEGLDEIPFIDTEIRKKINGEYHLKGLQWLQDKIKKEDPLFFEMGEMQNPQRMLRALEVKLSTGKSIVEIQSGKKIKRGFEIKNILIDLPRPELYDNINRRVDQMMENGLLKEAESLLPHKNLNALQTVGYKELFDYFEGKISLAEAVDLIKKNTRHYAKRQMTWFRKQVSNSNYEL